MRVLIVDDHAVLRDGLKNILDQPRGTAVCGEASSAQEAIDSRTATGMGSCCPRHLAW